jgi:hypothetical protein
MVSSNIYQAEQYDSIGNDWGILKEGVKAYLNVPIYVASDLGDVFFVVTSMVHACVGTCKHGMCKSAASASEELRRGLHLITDTSH